VRSGLGRYNSFKGAVLLAALFPVLLLVAAASADSQTAGFQALNRGDYQQAEEIFSKAVAADPKDYASLFNLALAETSLKKDDLASAHYTQVLALKPGLYEAELNLGMLYLRDHRPADALPLLREAAKSKPGEVRPKRYLGDALLQTGDFPAASESFQDALKADPKSSMAELGLAQSLERQGKLDDALPHYTQAAELDPRLKSYLLEEAVALVKADRTKDAIPLLAQFPGDPGAREELGSAYLAQGRPADAVEQFQGAVKLSPTPANKLALATAYLKNNQPQLATPILQEALQSNPDDYDLRMAVGKISLGKRDFVSAAAQFVSAGKLKPGSAEAWNDAASAFIMAQQYPQALAAMDQVHRLHAEKPADFYWRAVVFDKLHQAKPALENYQQFLELSQGKFPDQEFLARQRSKILEKEARR
jgi:tetratricopeptide (TPR) repeat protein